MAYKIRTEYIVENTTIDKKFNVHGDLIEESYYICNWLCRLDGPCKIKYYKNGNIKSEYYNQGSYNPPHRIDGPAIIHYNLDGLAIEQYFYIDGQKFDDELQYLVTAAKYSDGGDSSG